MRNRGKPRKPTRVDLGDKTWVDVQMRLAQWVGFCYPRVDADIKQEALQDAVVDGMTYWQSLPSSHSDDVAKNFNFAVYRGKLFLRKHIPQLCNQHMVTPYDHDGTFWEREQHSEPSPDTVLEELDLEERARRVLAEMSNEELGEFFVYLGGASSREVAKRLGISQSTASREQAVRRTDLRKRARRYGLLS